MKENIDMKNNVAAGLLALFLGGLGIHKFYNGSWRWGILYILFVWTYVPALVAIIEAIIYLTNASQYDIIYNQMPPDPWKW